MGRRAKKAPVQTKKRPTLAKRFKCPFCANEDVVECKMDIRTGVGSLVCRVCQVDYQMPIHHLHEPIDVFSEWLDECEAVQHGKSGGGSASNNRNQENDDQRNEDLLQDDDDDDDDQVLGEASGLSRPAAAASGGTATNAQEEEDDDEQKQAATTTAQPSYSALGLDDSDSSDDE